MLAHKSALHRWCAIKSWCVSPPKELGIREYDVDIVWHQRIEQNPQLNWVKDALILASQKQLATAGPNASVAPLADYA